MTSLTRWARGCGRYGASAITLAELATTTGVSESTLSRPESGQRRATLELLLPLARTYAVPLDDLVRVRRRPHDEGDRHGMEHP
jgi:transcriptional regulator with XRE-family HTH domain